MAESPVATNVVRFLCWLHAPLLLCLFPYRFRRSRFLLTFRHTLAHTNFLTLSYAFTLSSEYGILDVAICHLAGLVLPHFPPK